MDDEINVENEIKSLYVRLFTCSHTVANKLNNKEMRNILIIRSKSLHCIYFGASWTCFSVITSSNFYVTEVFVWGTQQISTGFASLQRYCTTL